MSFEETTEHLAKLCRIKLTDEEMAKFKINLENILKYVELIDEIDTEGVQPCTHVLETLSNVMAEDIEAPTLPREIFLRNAPDQISGMIKVPTVIQFE